MPRLSVILASMRQGRIGEAVARWFMTRVQDYEKFDAALVDLKDVNLPLLSEPNHPRLRKYEQEATKAWSATVAASDAFVFVTPEYNHTMPPSLSNALDHLFHEWSYKPVGFVSYGGISAGLRSVQSAKLMVTSFKMVPILEAVNISYVAQSMENGIFTGSELAEKAVPVMLGELFRWSEALKTLRNA